MHRINFEGKQIHINCAKEDFVEYLLMLDDPDRVQKIATHWGIACEVPVYREFHSYTSKSETDTDEENAIKVANEAVKILRSWNQLKKNKRWLYPSLSANEATLRED